GFVPYRLILVLFILLALALALAALVARELFRLAERTPAPTNEELSPAAAPRVGSKTGTREDRKGAEAAIPRPPLVDQRFILGSAAGAILLLAIVIGIVFFRTDSLSLVQIQHGLARLFAPQQYRLPAIAGLLVSGIVVGFIAALLTYRDRAPL